MTVATNSSLHSDALINEEYGPRNCLRLPQSDSREVERRNRRDLLSVRSVRRQHTGRTTSTINVRTDARNSK